MLLHADTLCCLLSGYHLLKLKWNGINSEHGPAISMQDTVPVCSCHTFAEEEVLLTRQIVDSFQVPQTTLKAVSTKSLQNHPAILLLTNAFSSPPFSNRAIKQCKQITMSLNGPQHQLAPRPVHYSYRRGGERRWGAKTGVVPGVICVHRV